MFFCSKTLLGIIALSISIFIYVSTTLDQREFGKQWAAKNHTLREKAGGHFHNETKGLRSRPNSIHLASNNSTNNNVIGNGNEHTIMDLHTTDHMHMHPEENENVVMYGHIHMAKTGGTSLNGVLANTYERVCGHKGYSYDAYSSNERAKAHPEKINFGRYSRDRVNPGIMEDIGFENCDYVSHELDWMWWNKFGNRKFHNISMELHVPCRDPIDHLMSQCNHGNRKLVCDAATDEEFIKSVKSCEVELSRYSHALKRSFERVKCFDFKKQFTTYVEYMSKRLQRRRIVSTPHQRRETNALRNRTDECIWNHPEWMEKARSYLLKTHDYYALCDECMGTENEITRAYDKDS